MLKNITIGVLVFVSVFFVVYANIKANEAEKRRLQAELNLARENQAKAREQEQKATEAAAKALIEQRKAEKLQEQLEACKN